jgi:hypothetical protein
MLRRSSAIGILLSMALPALAPVQDASAHAVVPRPPVGRARYALYGNLQLETCGDASARYISALQARQAVLQVFNEEGSNPFASMNWFSVPNLPFGSLAETFQNGSSSDVTLFFSGYTSNGTPVSVSRSLGQAQSVTSGRGTTTFTFTQAGVAPLVYLNSYEVQLAAPSGSSTNATMAMPLFNGNILPEVIIQRNAVCSPV